MKETAKYTQTKDAEQGRHHLHKRSGKSDQRANKKRSTELENIKQGHHHHMSDVR